MTIPPIPVIFEPHFKPKPWGGRKLESLVAKRLPDAPAIGESWELVDLPEHESRIAGGPLAGKTIGELVALWGEKLLGGAHLINDRFPLMVKFLDAREHLSVQVHPKPKDDEDWTPGVKHEAWYVVHAEPGAELFIGLKPGVSARQFAASAASPVVSELLQHWPARVGQCYTLPSGVPHALGAGVVVAEVQTPSDITYRLYDWDRVGLDGQPRELHRTEALANLRDDVPRSDILGPRSHIAGPFATISRLAASERFIIDRVRFIEGVTQPIPHADMVIWVLLSGTCRFRRGDYERAASTGDTVLIPADSFETTVSFESDGELLEVKAPIPSTLAGFTRPDRDARANAHGLVSLTEHGRTRLP